MDLAIVRIREYVNNMRNYDDIGLTDNLLSTDSVLKKNPRRMTGLDSDSLVESQGKAFRISQVTNPGLVVESTSVAAGGPLLAGNQGVYTVNLHPHVTADSRYKSFGIPYISAYIGTSVVGTMQVYPQLGSGVTPGQFLFTSGFDYARLASMGSNSYMVSIYNNSGGSVNVYFISRWRYTNHGTVSTTIGGTAV